MLYIGTYHDQNAELRLDINSLNPIAYRAINQLYDDMMKLNIVDGANQKQFVEHQIDELNQSNCDLIMLDNNDVKQFLKQLSSFNL